MYLTCGIVGGPVPVDNWGETWGIGARGKYVYTDMYTDMCIDLCIDMCIDVCVDMCKPEKRTHLWSIPPNKL